MHTKEEQNRSERLRPLIEKYEIDVDNRDSIKREIETITTYDVSDFELLSYWESCSLDEFSLNLSVIPVKPDEMDDETIENVLKEMCASEDIAEQEYLNGKYSNAIEYKFRKPAGFLYENIMDDELDYKAIIVLLNSDEDGPICL